MMTIDQLEDWLKQEAPQAGARAALVREKDGNVRALSYSPRYTAEALRGACQFLFNAFEVANLHRLPHEMMRWSFSEAEIYCTCRTDGLMLVLLLGVGESLAEDRVKVESLLLNFTAAD